MLEVYLQARRIDGATGSIKDGIGETLFWVVEIGANDNSYSWTTIVDRVNIFVELAIMWTRAEIATPSSASTI